MYCGKCGTRNEGNAYCVKCGQPLERVPPGAGRAAPGSGPVSPRVVVARPRRRDEDDPVMRMLMPVGRSGLAIAAGYAGLFGLLIAPAPLALILGLLAVGDLRKNPHKRGMGRAVFGLIIGILGTGLLVWVLIELARG